MGPSVFSLPSGTCSWWDFPARFWPQCQLPIPLETCFLPGTLLCCSTGQWLGAAEHLDLPLGLAAEMDADFYFRLVCFLLKMTLGSTRTLKNVDELPLLLWENLPVCPCLSVHGNVPRGMALNTGICGDGEKGPTSPVECHLSHTQGWGYKLGPLSPSLLEHWAQRGRVCLCVPCKAL